MSHDYDFLHRISPLAFDTYFDSAFLVVLPSGKLQRINQDYSYVVWKSIALFDFWVLSI